MLELLVGLVARGWLEFRVRSRSIYLLDLSVYVTSDCAGSGLVSTQAAVAMPPLCLGFNPSAGSGVFGYSFSVEGNFLLYLVVSFVCVCSIVVIAFLVGFNARPWPLESIIHDTSSRILSFWLPFQSIGCVKRPLSTRSLWFSVVSNVEVILGESLITSVSAFVLCTHHCAVLAQLSSRQCTLNFFACLETFWSSGGGDLNPIFGPMTAWRS
ncbi:hypothetical protein Bca52824_011177 [Brassica carinata]|uniref:Uncharacterized protein n=1 Tax=Brassica carinata TaxID=52824 RepID=A0A8X8B8A3_BRACI|nr:hypothetical protein Bca52824_011177 [Brassica carinata]